MKREKIPGIRLAAIGLTMLVTAGPTSSSQPADAASTSGGASPMLNSLSTEEIRGLREGEGMGLARAAELNGYPGPTHVLEAARAGKIELYADQRQAIERIQAAMKSAAQALGEQILDMEARLEAGFRENRMAEADLVRQVEDIGRQRAALRLTHLRAHLLTAALLRPEQIEEYYQYRGYVPLVPGHRHGQ